MKVGIVMGSISDEKIIEKTIEVLKDFNVPYEVRIISAHRTPKQAEEYARTAEERGLDVIIAVAGKAAHLAGVMAGNTILPVIGIPAKTSDLGGMDSLLSVVQMPKGVPVATVAISGGENAALLAIQMLGIKEEALRVKFHEYKKKMEETIVSLDQEYNGEGK